MSQFAFNLTELIVDSFAGGGGASTGIEAALGRPVDIAVNHDEEALSMHAANHPGTLHLREDVWAVNPRKALGKRQIGLLWASPDCKHFSKAKGGKPVSKRIRGLAWVICKWAAITKPRVICMENVEEFQDWGPLKQIDGQWFPDPDRKGLTFNRFVTRLRNLGYKVEHRQLKACDYGAPTIRKRLFLVARRDGLPIVWPKPTHGKGLKPYRTAAECIDWSIPCPSIFERKKPLAEATLRRIARGIQRYVIDAAEPFIVPMQHQNRPTGLGEPLQTVTTQGNKFGLVVPHVTKFRANSTGHAIDEPMHTVTASSFVKRPGGAAPVGLVAASLTRVDQASAAARNGIGGADEPLRTIHTAPAHAVIAAHLEHITHGGREHPADEPLRTVTGAPRGEIAMVGATLAHIGNGERDGQAPRCMNIERPLGTVVAEGQKQALVTAFLAQHNSEPKGQPKPGRDAREPVSTLCASGSHQAVVAAQLVGVGGRAGQSRPRGADEAAGTLTAKADTALAAAHLVKLKGTSKDGQPADEPLHTVGASGNHFAEVRAFLIRYYGTGGQWSDLQEPMATLPANDRIGLVMVHGEPYQIVDIGMRMLTPRELATAQGFPADYVIDRGADGRPLTKTAQVRMIGNSVVPQVAEALIKANFSHELKVKNRRAA